MDEFEKEHKIVSLFIDNAKTYMQLSTGALVLSVTFIQQILGTKGNLVLDGWLIASWICFLLSIIAGALYQWLAVKRLEKESKLGRHHGVLVPEWMIDRTYLSYGAMMLCFYLGVILFTGAAIVRL